MKTTKLIPQFVEFIPELLEDGIIYISNPYKIAIHLCACGCGNQTVTPFNSPTEWNLTVDELDVISLSPSIGNFQFPCKSHYWIKRNVVEWC